MDELARENARTTGVTDDQKAVRHTPGPWQCYADLPSTEPNWHIVTNASRMRVLANVHIEPGNAVDESNARLIVAAPDLLEVAARWAIAMWQSGIQPIENSDGPLEAMLFDTHAALLKATGRDVVADALEAICAGNRAALAKAEAK